MSTSSTAPAAQQATYRATEAAPAARQAPPDLLKFLMSGGNLRDYWTCQAAAEPKPEPAAAEPQPIAGRGPTGPVLEAAAVEPNWYVVEIVPVPGKRKLRKVPLDGAGRRVGVQVAAVLTLAQALQQRDRMAAAGAWVALGYLPRPGSAMVAGDLDDSLPPPWENDSQPIITEIARQVLAESCTYAERSIGGTGIRLLMQRDARTPLVTAEAGDAGLFTDGKRGAVLTFDPLPGRERAVVAAARAEQLILQHIEAARPDPVAADADAESAAFHWFGQAESEARQLEEVERMLGYLTDPKYGEYDCWLRLSIAVWHATDSMGFEIWDAWCQQLPGYDAEENAKKWESFGQDHRNRSRSAR
jgi:hypothetical protein